MANFNWINCKNNEWNFVLTWLILIMLIKERSISIKNKDESESSSIEWLMQTMFIVGVSVLIELKWKEVLKLNNVDVIDTNNDLLQLHDMAMLDGADHLVLCASMNALEYSTDCYTVGPIAQEFKATPEAQAAARKWVEIVNRRQRKLQGIF